MLTDSIVSVYMVLIAFSRAGHHLMQQGTETYLIQLNNAFVLGSMTHCRYQNMHDYLSQAPDREWTFTLHKATQSFPGPHHVKESDVC